MAVFGTETDEPLDWLRCGQALQSVLLRARARGVFGSYLNQPIELPSLRDELLDLLGRTGFPQLLVRMGYGPDCSPVARRSVEEVIR